MKDKLLIFGKGFIGERLAEFFSCDVSERRINSFRDAQEEISRYRPKAIINCVGFTGARNVDDCEGDIDATLSANTFVPVILAEAALRNNIKLIHISSGCIYHYDYVNSVPILEGDPPDFFELFYSRSKIYSERALLPYVDRHNFLLARIRVPLDSRPHKKNLLNKLIGYKKVIDTPNSVTYIPDFLDALRHLISVDAKGIYNIVNKGGLYYPKLMDAYKRHVPEFNYEIIKLETLNLVRSNLILSTKKLEDSGFIVRPIDAIIEECVKSYSAGDRS